MPSFTEALFELHQTSGVIELFDLTAPNEQEWHITPVWAPDGFITYGGTQYTCFPVAAVGWQLSTTGTLPRPTLSVSNVVPEFLLEVVTQGDLVGTEVRRYFTYEKFLDGKPDADPGAHSAIEVYYIEQKLEHTDTLISWQCISPFDQDVVLPRRQFLKDNLDDVNPETGVKRTVWAPGLSSYISP